MSKTVGRFFDIVAGTVIHATFMIGGQVISLLLLSKLDEGLAVAAAFRALSLKRSSLFAA